MRSSTVKPKLTDGDGRCHSFLYLFTITRLQLQSIHIANVNVTIKLISNYALEIKFPENFSLYFTAKFRTFTMCGDKLGAIFFATCQIL